MKKRNVFFSPALFLSLPPIHSYLLLFYSLFFSSAHTCEQNDSCICPSPPSLSLSSWLSSSHTSSIALYIYPYLCVSSFFTLCAFPSSIALYLSPYSPTPLSLSLSVSLLSHSSLSLTHLLFHYLSLTLYTSLVSLFSSLPSVFISLSLLQHPSSSSLTLTALSSAISLSFCGGVMQGMWESTVSAGCHSSPVAFLLSALLFCFSSRRRNQCFSVGFFFMCDCAFVCCVAIVPSCLCSPPHSSSLSPTDSAILDTVFHSNSRLICLITPTVVY